MRRRSATDAAWARRRSTGSVSIRRKRMTDAQRVEELHEGSYLRRGVTAAIRWRMSSSVPGMMPAARAWMTTLPSAVASTGPAITGRPVASAVSWQSRSFCEPPPTMWTTSTSRSASVGGLADGAGVAVGERVEDAAHGRGRRRGRRPAAARSARASAGGDEGRVVDVDAGPAGQAAGAAARSRARGRRAPTSRRHSWSSHSPPTLRRKRVRPSTPTSLVKLALPGGLGEDGSVELEADERPRAAGDVGEAVGGGRHARRPPRRCRGSATVVTVRAVVGRAPRIDPAARAAGAAWRGCRAGRGGRSDHCLGAGVEQAGGRRVGQPRSAAAR